MPWPVSTTTGTSGDEAWICLTRARPSAPGRRKSVSTTSMGACASTRTASADRARLHDVVAALAQDLRERVADVDLVLDHEHAAAGDVLPAPAVLMRPPCARERAGRVIWKTVPPPGRGCASSRPPCCRTMEWQIDRPRPVEFLVEKNGSKMRSRSAAAMPGPRSATSARTLPSVGLASSRAPRLRRAGPRRR